ncbi:MAG: hypothetical protein WCO66_04615 [Candidatus Absconditabacteria bacterium]
MKISIGFSGAAGTGVNTSGLLLGQLLASKGYSLLADKEYASIIKGDNNNFFLYISDKKEEIFITKGIDYFFAFDDYSVTKNQTIYDFKNIYNVKEQTSKRKNVFCFGASLKLLSISLEEGIAALKTQFSPEALDENVIELTNGYAYMQNISDFNASPIIDTPKTLMFGNECIGKGAMESGLDFYSAYPMTPASSLIDVITPDHRVTFFQGEDEIAVSMAMLGAKYGGKRAMCGTSGGGFALMTESISFSNQAEIGGVYVLAQRDGPSTGTPTFTGQGDIAYALNASFGDTLPIVLAPSTFEEAYTFAGKALNWSDTYQHPVIMLTDKQLSESYKTIDPQNLKAEAINRGKLYTPTAEDNYERYSIADDGISPNAVPGTANAVSMVTSYEHDTFGSTNEEPVMKGQMEDKRRRKADTFMKIEFNENFYGYEIINPEAKKFFITLGANRYVLESYIKDHADENFGLIVIKVLQPFDARLATFLEEKNTQIEKLIFVEMNPSGQMERLVTEQCKLADNKRNGKITHHRKYTLYPIFEEELINF